MKITLSYLGAAAMFLAACGGGGNAALSRNFAYGSAQTPTSSDQTAASTATTNLSAASSFSSSPSATSGASVVDFAMVLGSLAFGSSGVPVRLPGDVTISSALRSAADLSSCGTVSGNTVTFNNCTDSSAGTSITINGSITATANSVTWNISGSFSGTETSSTGQTINFNFNLHEAGSLTVTSTKVTGNATADFGGSVSSQGQTINFGIATAALVDVTYQGGQTPCITSGSVEVKRVWTQRPAAASGAQYDDVGVKLVWSACNTFTVAHSQ
ncbi:MAG: hypothetical protein E6J78_07245 [Deltaproteobacteria bacterium]|nr:MAG: hypothetical protein E6J78_07245 [Deltaproteobacteria bacterium]